MGTHARLAGSFRARQRAHRCPIVAGEGENTRRSLVRHSLPATTHPPDSQRSAQGKKRLVRRQGVLEAAWPVGAV